ncbi:MAG TPA: flagellar filament capping protein FliD, partial [Polyangiaceae bacterium]|nr:flagellar filament capping protein FliD [Polyangiaceae bacterium]
SIGLSIARDGTMSLDGTKLSKALSANPEAVTKILAGTSTSDGIMDSMSSVADLFNRSNTGLLANKRATLDSSLKKLQARADAQQDLLENYRTQLEKQFSVMEDAYSNANTVSAYLAAMSGNGNSKG